MLLRLQPGSCLIGQLVIPAALPGEVGHRQLIKRNAVDQVIKPPPGRDVPDHQNPPLGPAQRQVIEERADPPYRLPPALAARMRLIEMGAAAGLRLDLVRVSVIFPSYLHGNVVTKPVLGCRTPVNQRSPRPVLPG